MMSTGAWQPKPPAPVHSRPPVQRAGAAPVGAPAYATGNHVAFAGQTRLHTGAHEAARGVQRRAGSAEDLLTPIARGGSGAGGAIQRMLKRGREEEKAELPDTSEPMALESVMSTAVGSASSSDAAPDPSLPAGKRGRPTTTITHIPGTFHWEEESEDSDGHLTIEPREERVGIALEAYLHPIDPRQGSGTGGSPGVARLTQKLQSKSGSSMVQGHLLNHHLGGLAVPENLYPITAQANAIHKNYVENFVKELVHRDGMTVRYTVRVAGKHNEDEPNATFVCRVWTENDDGGFEPRLSKEILSDPGTTRDPAESVRLIAGEPNTFPESSKKFPDHMVSKGWGKAARRGMGNFAYDHAEAPTRIVDPTADGKVHAIIASPPAPAATAAEEKTDSDDPTGGP